MAKVKKEGGKLIKETKERALARSKKRLADLLALIRRRLTVVVEGFYDIGEALRDIVEHKLYAAEGHTSLAALLEAEGMMSISQANKLIAVVRKVPREQALALGPDKAYALTVYADATPEADSAAQIVADDAEIGGKRASDASGRDILNAARDVREKTKEKGPKTSAEREKAKADKALERALGALLRGAGVHRATIKIAADTVHITLSRSVALKATRP